MASFDDINYSIRPAKSIQQLLIFDSIKNVIDRHLDLVDPIYVGLSSVWFTDFLKAHRILGIDHMISIEMDEIAFRRAIFNRPFHSVDVKRGHSTEVIQEMVEDARYSTRSWIVWLDYDGILDEGVLDDMRQLVENAPVNSIILFTFNAHERSYGKLLSEGNKERLETLRSLFGSVFRDEISNEDLKKGVFQRTLTQLVLEKLTSFAAGSARTGGFQPAFEIVYADGSAMATVGGILPSKGDRKLVQSIVEDVSWMGRPAEVILAPPLTLLEALKLQAAHPREHPLTRQDVQQLGFDLRQEQIDTFGRYYKMFPIFAQIF